MHKRQERTPTEVTLQAILETVSFAADQFVRTTGLDNHITEILERLGNATQVSRVYIFVNDEDDQGTQMMNQRYEWAAPGITPQIDNPDLQNLSYEELGFTRWQRFLSRRKTIFGKVSGFPENEQAILLAQDIQSILVVPIFVDRQWWGFIGFDDCDKEREWNVTEIDALKAIANIIGVAVQHEHMQTQLRQARNTLAQQVQERTNELRIFQLVVEHSPYGIFVANMEAIITYANLAFREMYRYDHDIVGVHLANLAQHSQERVDDLYAHLIKNTFWANIVTHERKDGSTFPVQVSTLLVRDNQDNPQLIISFHQDMTEQVAQEQERAQLQQDIIEAQRAAIGELSTPLVPLSDHILLLPVVGSIDTQRAQSIMETLLEGIDRHQAEVAILDMTGISVVDTQVAQALIQSAQAVQLLGAEVVLTGISPAMAQTLVTLGADLSTITTKGNLQRGIAWAMQRQH